MGQRLKGKVAVVTGGGGGIGRGVALAMSAEGASVVVTDPAVKDGVKVADKVVDEIKKLNGSAVANYDSVATIIGAEKIIDTAVSNFGRVDILVNCAGNFMPVPTVEMTQENWDSIMAVHLGGHFACSRAAAKQMIKQKSPGSITNISSFAGFPRYDPRGAAYSTAKAGVVGFTLALSYEFKQYGIRVNAIFPLATTQLFPGTTPRGGSIMPSTTSLNPEDIAPIFVYLGTDEAKDITGQMIYAAGGDFCILDRPMKPRLFVRKTGKWTVDELVSTFPGLNLEV